VNIRNQLIQNRFRSFGISLLLLVSQVSQADQILPPPDFDLSQPAISIIIDDMGYRLQSGNRAINLPGAVTYSFLPYSPHVKALSKLAHDKNKEVMLHLPMESENNNKLGPGGLTECMTEKKFINVLESSIKSIPYIKGFNNHMGSLLTKSNIWMTRLMQEIAVDNRLYFVDSKTTKDSVALKIAREEGIQSIQRDIFIDHEETDVFIRQQLKKLIRKAKREGTALAIAHPKKETLAILENWIPLLHSQGIRLVPVSSLIQMQQQKKYALWKKNIQ